MQMTSVGKKIHVENRYTAESCIPTDTHYRTRVFNDTLKQRHLSMLLHLINDSEINTNVNEYIKYFV